MLRPVSKEETLKRRDYYEKIGSWKNETFQPFLFPDQERFPSARPHFGYYKFKIYRKQSIYNSEKVILNKE